MQLIIFLVTTASLTYGVTKTDLFKSARENASSRNIKLNEGMPKIISWRWWFLDHVLNCTFCFGFWASVPSYVMVSFGPQWLCYPFLGCAASMLFFLIIKKLS